MPPRERHSRATRTGLPLLGLALLALLLCLVPKPENDLFFELRTGTDILRTGHLPHADPYSWTRHGTRWDVPEWGAFVLYAAAHRAAGFLGTWLVLAALTLAATALVWTHMVRHAAPPAAAWAATALMLLAASPCLQERPYAFTYPFLAAALILLMRGRRDPHPRALCALCALVPLCALWTNLHQGVLAFTCLIAACAVGDALTAARRRRQAAQSPPDLLTETGRAHAARRDADPDGPRAHAARARRMLLTAAACAAAALASPYGPGVYRSVLVTLRDPQLMSGVTEWNPITVLPPTQLPPFLLLSLLTLATLALSALMPTPSAPASLPSDVTTAPPMIGGPGGPPNGPGGPLSPAGPPPFPSPPPSLAEALMLAALFAEALLHARNTALFAVGAATLIAPHLAPAQAALTQRLRLPPPTPARRALPAILATLCLLTAAAACLTGLRRAAGPLGLTPEGVAQAAAQVPTYPAAACDFLDAQRFPSRLRLLNSFEDGGYLMWRIPREPVFIDGRLDIYAGQTFADTLTLSRAPGSPAAAALLARYDLDCVLTRSPRQSRALSALPDWQLVYTAPPAPNAPRTRIFLRRRPRFAPLIARCLAAQTQANAPMFTGNPGRVNPSQTGERTPTDPMRSGPD